MNTPISTRPDVWARVEQTSVDDTAGRITQPNDQIRVQRLYRVVGNAAIVVRGIDQFGQTVDIPLDRFYREDRLFILTQFSIDMVEAS